MARIAPPLRGFSLGITPEGSDFRYRIAIGARLNLLLATGKHVASRVGLYI
jgi:hypothetical protein